MPCGDVPVLEYMVAANVAVVFKYIMQSFASRDVVTDAFETPERLDVIIVALWSGCVQNLFFQLHYGRWSADQWVFKGQEKV